MSDPIKHECGIGIIRLRKPLNYYQEKYGSPLWGLNKMYLLMEKQHNRGQDGAGMACVKLDVPEGRPYMARIRKNKRRPWSLVFNEVREEIDKLENRYPGISDDPELLKQHFPFAGEVLLGHLRYGTHGDNTIGACHPVLRNNNWKSRSLVVAGNFNLTNVGALFKKLVEDFGQHPVDITDTETVLERIGHYLDKENRQLEEQYLEMGYQKREIAKLIAGSLDVRKILTKSAKAWDGGYTMGGLIGNGDAFVLRDPNGIRPAYYWYNDEVSVVASERPTISTVFDVNYQDIQELPPAHALIMKADGENELKAFAEAGEKKSCSFERIYFSRGNDPDIYRERMALGDLLVDKILQTVRYDLDNTVFGYIPNTAETSFWGMIKGVETYLNEQKIKDILALNGSGSLDRITRILHQRPRVEKVILKDQKLRTFIADDKSRDDLVGHVYDITQGVLKPGVDNFVCIDDSIVRGTTLKKSILKILMRLEPKRIIIVSSAPQIRYPDCYGIDMSKIGRFIAFQAAIELLKDRGEEHIIRETYQGCLALKENDLMESKNLVKAIYAPFTEDQISRKIAQLLKPKEMKSELHIVYQPLENLSKAIPNNLGDWYFSGNYPTPGGNRVVNQAFINYHKGVLERAY